MPTSTTTPKTWVLSTRTGGSCGLPTSLSSSVPTPWARWTLARSRSCASSWRALSTKLPYRPRLCGARAHNNRSSRVGEW